MYQIRFWTGTVWMDFISTCAPDCQHLTGSYDWCSKVVNYHASQIGWPIADSRNWKIIGPIPDEIPSWQSCIHEEVETDNPPSPIDKPAFVSDVIEIYW